MPLPAFLSWFFPWRSSQPPAAAPAPPVEAEPRLPPEPPFDAAVALRRWLAEDQDLRSLYHACHVQPSLEETCGELLGRAKALLRVEIPDPQAFAEALEKLAKSAASGLVEPGAEAAWALRGRDPLLLDVLALRHDLVAVRARLDERPVDELLPFLEEIPSRRGGEVVWRLPREPALLRRRPLRIEAFLALLEELGNTLHRTTIERRAELREALQESITRTGRDALEAAIYLPASLRALEERLTDWLAAPSQEARDKRRRLDEFLLEILAVHHPLSRRVAEAEDPAEDLDNAVARARALAAEMLATSWLQVDFLLSRLLHLLLLAELALTETPSCPQKVALEACATEAASGFFDAAEMARRLRGLEHQGFFVSSLLLALLRLIQEKASKTALTPR